MCFFQETIFFKKKPWYDSKHNCTCLYMFWICRLPIKHGAVPRFSPVPKDVNGVAVWKAQMIHRCASLLVLHPCNSHEGLVLPSSLCFK